MYRSIPLLIGLSTSLLTVGCYIPGSEKEVEWTILAHRSPNWEHEHFEDGKWVASASMSLQKESPESVPWEFPSGLIDGFQHEWGMKYRLRVRSRAPISNYLEIGPDRVFNLVELVAKTSAAGEEFHLHSIGAPWFGADRRRFSDGQAFSCGNPGACEALDRRLRDVDARFDMRMEHGAKSGELRLLAVEDPTCTTTSECRNPPTHAPQDICCRGTCTAPNACKGDPWR